MAAPAEVVVGVAAVAVAVAAAAAIAEVMLIHASDQAQETGPRPSDCGLDCEDPPSQVWKS